MTSICVNTVVKNLQLKRIKKTNYAIVLSNANIALDLGQKSRVKVVSSLLPGWSGEV